jgi:hypothetical protein
VKRGGSLSFLVGTISNVLVMEIGWTDVGSGGYILVSCSHSNTSLLWEISWEFWDTRKPSYLLLVTGKLYHIRLYQVHHTTGGRPTHKP